MHGAARERPCSASATAAAGLPDLAAQGKARNTTNAVPAKMRAAFPGAIIWCGGFTGREAAQAALDTGLVDLIAFGRPYIGNPDLAERLRHGWPLHEADRSTYYTRRGELGYTDFPRYQAAAAECTPA